MTSKPVMRTLFVTFGAPSHFYPMVPLAWALRAAGHDVLVVHPPGLEAVVAESGLPSFRAGDPADLDAAWSTPPPAASPTETSDDSEELRRSLRAVGVFLAVADAMAAETVAVARDFGVTHVVYEPRAYAGQLAALRLDVPALRHLYGTDYTYGRWGLERAVIEPYFDRHGAAIALPHGDLTIDPCPPALQLPTTEHRSVMRYVPYNGAGAVPEWLREPVSRPRLCVTWGTTSGKFLGHLQPVHDVLAATAELDVEVVVAVRAGDRVRLGEVPPGVRVAQDVPLHVWLATCAAIVHQGGAGTTITSFVSGVPQLVLPAIADQFVNGRRAADTGAGRCIDLAVATVDGIRAAVADLLADPRYRRAAVAGSELARREPSPARVAAALAIP